ncbi:DUF4188 domain-containing protein [Camelliibacillus cellulosilyticus]|uniref:DUF4188 domain-containing protein n=1 Tax=Camelliibacillus cellulosilyticus TaxID=2174486 RepID=A0ABV9GNE1_9BACL
MAKAVYQGRYTAKTDEPYVVFIIGMRINRFLAFRKWIPVFRAMTPMIRELYEHSELGFLHTEISWNFRRVVFTQYWRSYDNLLYYAHGQRHLQAWQQFNQLSRNNHAVGVFHETYVIEKGSSEAIYDNMPRQGLAKAFEHEKVTKETKSSKLRMRRGIK